MKFSLYPYFSVSGGELFERIIDEDFELTERECIKYMKQISEGVQYIHKQGIVHLDLKPENIMCVNKTGTSIKLIDFGLARRLGNKSFDFNFLIRFFIMCTVFQPQYILNC